jgi:hypothetical protein
MSVKNIKYFLKRNNEDEIYSSVVEPLPSMVKAWIWSPEQQSEAKQRNDPTRGLGVLAWPPTSLRTAVSETVSSVPPQERAAPGDWHSMNAFYLWSSKPWGRECATLKGFPLLNRRSQWGVHVCRERHTCVHACVHTHSHSPYTHALASPDAPTQAPTDNNTHSCRCTRVHKTHRPCTRTLTPAPASWCVCNQLNCTSSLSVHCSWHNSPEGLLWNRVSDFQVFLGRDMTAWLAGCLTQLGIQEEEPWGRQALRTRGRVGHRD